MKKCASEGLLQHCSQPRASGSGRATRFAVVYPIILVLQYRNFIEIYSCNDCCEIGIRYRVSLHTKEQIASTPHDTTIEMLKTIEGSESVSFKLVAKTCFLNLKKSQTHVPGSLARAYIFLYIYIYNLFSISSGLFKGCVFAR